jgi:hypothetical protein
MFGSQALETAIGLALLFFVLAALASGIVENISRLLRKRARDLERTIGKMLSDNAAIQAAATAARDDATAAGASGSVARKASDAAAQAAADRAMAAALAAFKSTVVYHSANVAASVGRRWYRTDVGPAYLSAKSFAEAIAQLSPDDLRTMNPWLAKVVLQGEHLAAEGAELSLEARAKIENWYDETMARLGGAYKRWATAVLFVVGLGLAVAGNVSAVHATQTIWQQPAVRAAAVDAAEQVAQKSATPDVRSAVTSVEGLGGLGVPVGWEQGTHWNQPVWVVTHLVGWLITALLLMLGAPFWFDALSRLVSLRATGTRPPPAAQDPAAATSILNSAAPGAVASVVAGTAAAQLAASAAAAAPAPDAPAAPAAPAPAPDAAAALAPNAAAAVAAPTPAASAGSAAPAPAGAPQPRAGEAAADPAVPGASAEPDGNPD